MKIKFEFEGKTSEYELTNLETINFVASLNKEKNIYHLYRQAFSKNKENRFSTPDVVVKDLRNIYYDCLINSKVEK